MPKGIRKERAEPKAGMKFTRRFNGKEHILTVVKDGNDTKYMVGEETFDTPTAAARSLIGNKYAVNGWLFWGMKNY